MGKKDLNKDELQLLQTLLELSSEILGHYENIWLLEVNNKKSSNDFEVVKEALKFDINIENSIYEKLKEKININPIENGRIINDMIEYLFPYNVPSFEDELELIKRSDYSELIKVRVLERLYDLSNGIIINELDNDEFCDEEVVNNILDILELNEEEYDEDEDYIDEVEEDDELENIKDMNRYDILMSSVEKDFINTILAVLNKTMHKEDYSNILYELIKIKYNFSYIFSFQEKYMLENNMEINNTLFIESKLVQEFQKSDESYLNNAFNNVRDDIIANQIECMYEVIYEEDEEFDKLLYTLLSEIYLRVCLIFGNKKDIKKFSDTLSFEFNNNNVNTKIISDIVKDVLKECNSDRLMPNVLRLAPYVK